MPRAALEAAIAQKDEVIPELLRVIDDTIERAEELSEENGYMAHIYAMFLLAQFRETRAYPSLVRFAALPEELIHSLLGDVLTEDFGRILASVSGGDPHGIQSIIENADVDEWVRGEAFVGLLTLVAQKQLTRDAALDYCSTLFHGKLEREPSEVWNSLVATVSDLYPDELMTEIEKAYEDDLIDPGNVDFSSVQQDLTLGKDHVLARLADDPHHRMVENTIAEIQWWACFRGGDRDDDVEEEDELEALNAWDAPDENFDPEPERQRFTVTAPIKRTQPKIGRNDPCPCGSGKKVQEVLWWLGCVLIPRRKTGMMP